MATTRNMLIIKDASGKIIAAQLEGRPDDDIVGYISPVESDHSLFRVSNVPEKVYNRVHPADFQETLTTHVNSSGAEVAPVTVEELQNFYSGL